MSFLEHLWKPFRCAYKNTWNCRCLLYHKNSKILFFVLSRTQHFWMFLEWKRGRYRLATVSFLESQLAELKLDFKSNFNSTRPSLKFRESFRSIWRWTLDSKTWIFTHSIFRVATKHMICILNWLQFGQPTRVILHHFRETVLKLNSPAIDISKRSLASLHALFLKTNLGNVAKLNE